MFKMIIFLWVALPMAGTVYMLPESELAVRVDILFDCLAVLLAFLFVINDKLVRTMPHQFCASMPECLLYAASNAILAQARLAHPHVRTVRFHYLCMLVDRLLDKYSVRRRSS